MRSVMTGGCVFTTLFTLLFWDIIFMPIDGAFDTHFQTCPLDLCEDTFFAARQEVIEHRLSEIKAGKAVLYLKKHDHEHRAAEPCAVGVRWDLCSKKDLIEIVRVRLILRSFQRLTEFNQVHAASHFGYNLPDVLRGLCGWLHGCSRLDCVGCGKQAV